MHAPCQALPNEYRYIFGGARLKTIMVTIMTVLLLLLLLRFMFQMHTKTKSNLPEL